MGLTEDKRECVTYHFLRDALSPASRIITEPSCLSLGLYISVLLKSVFILMAGENEERVILVYVHEVICVYVYSG